jgi:hypothetical protein
MSSQASGVSLWSEPKEAVPAGAIPRRVAVVAVSSTRLRFVEGGTPGALIERVAGDRLRVSRTATVQAARVAASGPAGAATFRIYG